MPRRKSRVPDRPFDEGNALMLPPPQVRSKGHGHDHREDPYETPPGAVVVHPSTIEPIKRKMSKEDIAQRDEARKVAKMRGNRYNLYLDLLADHDGDQEKALSVIYDLPIEEVRLRRIELQADVRQGIGTSSLAEVLERNDLDLAARANLLRKHAYSNNPAASLKSIDMIQDLEGDRSDVGSFEAYLRLAKSSKG
jgi:hypothetical protein